MKNFLLKLRHYFFGIPFPQPVNVIKISTDIPIDFGGGN